MLAASNRTPPLVETTLGADDQDSTAVKPTPKCPTESRVSRLADARSDDSAATPSAVSTAPVLATRSSRPCQPDSDPGRDTRLAGGISSVGRELDQHPSGVAADRQRLLGVGVLPEPRRRRGPGVQHDPAQLSGAEGVRRGSVGYERGRQGVASPWSGQATSAG